MMMMEADSSLKLEDRPVLAPTIHDFDIMKPISRGAFGKVFLCHRKDAPEKTLAVKVMKKSELVQKNMVDQVIFKHHLGHFQFLVLRSELSEMPLRLPRVHS